jgi:hypothetical protein
VASPTVESERGLLRRVDRQLSLAMTLELWIQCVPRTQVRRYC